MLVKLHELGVDPNLVSSYGMPPLIMAARAGSNEIVEQLLTSGADIDGRDKSGRTALMAGARYRHSEVVKLYSQRALTLMLVQKTAGQLSWLPPIVAFRIWFQLCLSTVQMSTPDVLTMV